MRSSLQLLAQTRSFALRAQILGELCSAWHNRLLDTIMPAPHTQRHGTYHNAVRYWKSDDRNRPPTESEASAAETHYEAHRAHHSRQCEVLECLVAGAVCGGGQAGTPSIASTSANVVVIGASSRIATMLLAMPRAKRSSPSA